MQRAAPALLLLLGAAAAAATPTLTDSRANALQLLGSTKLAASELGYSELGHYVEKHIAALVTDGFVWLDYMFECTMKGVEAVGDDIAELAEVVVSVFEGLHSLMEELLKCSSWDCRLKLLEKVPVTVLDDVEGVVEAVYSMATLRKTFWKCFTNATTSY